MHITLSSSAISTSMYSKSSLVKVLVNSIFISESEIFDIARFPSKVFCSNSLNKIFDEKLRYCLIEQYWQVAFSLKEKFDGAMKNHQKFYST